MIEIDSGNWRQFASPAVNASEWTAVIPAAGRGSRLGSDKPKILYQVAGRPLLEWLLDFLEPSCSQIVFVLSPDGREFVQPELDRLLKGRYEIVIQDAPRGMGDAVEIALPSVRTACVSIVWGDQVALRRTSVDACLRLHTGPLKPVVTCPTVVRDKPYIHFTRDSSGGICDLLQAREGDPMPDCGESDTGFFCFDTDCLRGLLERVHQDAAQKGRSTGEFNLLPVIPLAARLGMRVLTPHLMTLEETVGINCAQDAGVVEAFLRDLSCQ
jgi:bifunctional UDP-N-acetylglucosamine pyrophosphorylase / glucosamine-1-phosphate N-acetyltransferase